MSHDENEQWLRFLRGFERGLRGDGPLVIEMPSAFEMMRSIAMTQAQRIAVANALRDAADKIEHDEVV
jgi:hypothetical protein